MRIVILDDAHHIVLRADVDVVGMIGRGDAG